MPYYWDGAMFKRVLICYNGSGTGRVALKQGADLAVLVGSEIHLLSILPSLDPAVVAAAAGYLCLIDEEDAAQTLLSDAVTRLRARGISTEGYVERGATIDVIVAYAKRLAIELVVVGHYPQPSRGRWWSGTDRAALADRIDCSVFIAVEQG
jgi:nucleotide-binding universal stress UspA family protein